MLNMFLIFQYHRFDFKIPVTLEHFSWRGIQNRRGRYAT